VKELENYLKNKCFEGCIMEEQRRTRRGEMFHPATSTWYPIAPMETRRSRHGLVVPMKKNAVGLWVQGRDIYAVGGYGGEVIGSEVALSSIAKYNIDTNSWTEMEPLAAARHGLASAAVEGCVYAIGGMGAQGELLSSVECYNTTLGKFAPARPELGTLPNMPTPRAVTACAVLNNQIYVCGGYTGDDHCCTVERLNPLNGTWTTCAPMPTGRSGASAVIKDDHLYVIGGYNGEDRLAVVEVYNYIEDSWSTAPAMSTPRTGCATVYCNRPTPQLPQNTVDYELAQFTRRFNSDNIDKAVSLLAPHCNFTFKSTAKDLQMGPFKTPQVASEFLNYFYSCDGCTNLKFTVTSVKGLQHEDTWTSDAGTGSSKATWKQVGGGDTPDDEDDDEWKIVDLEWTFTPKPEEEAAPAQ